MVGRELGKRESWMGREILVKGTDALSCFQEPKKTCLSFLKSEAVVSLLFTWDLLVNKLST